jgi:hypothetical protein
MKNKPRPGDDRGFVDGGKKTMHAVNRKTKTV